MARLIRIAEVAKRLGDVDDSYAWKRLATDPDAPKPIRLGLRLTVFDEAEVDQWIAALVNAAKGRPVKSALPTAEDRARGLARRKAVRKSSPSIKPKSAGQSNDKAGLVGLNASPLKIESR